MHEYLAKLIEAARNRPFPPEEREAQRRSFAYGNTHIENPLITREMVNEQDELLKAELQAR
jgi:endonuclease I